MKTIIVFAVVLVAVNANVRCGGSNVDYSSYFLRAQAASAAALDNQGSVCGESSYVSRGPSFVRSVPVVAESAAVIATSAPAVAATAPSVSTTNSAARYRVYLDNCGPKTKRLPAVSAPTVTTRPVQGPIVTLPYRVPNPRTVYNSCKCVKTIVKPQTVEQIITIPLIKKYVETLARPTYEVINYQADPINCPLSETYAC